MLPRVCAHLPPIPVDRSPTIADRRCEEVVRGRPEGEAYYWVRVRRSGLSTRQAVAAVARAAGLDERQVAHAGPRDREADCISWFSVPAEPVDNPGQLSGAGYKRKLRVLDVATARRAIRPDDVVALDWRLRLRRAGSAYDQARALLDHLRSHACPNYYGAAVLGRGGQQAKWGRLLAQGKALPPQVRARARPQRCLRALQARLFNAYVAARVDDGLLARAVSGDMIQTRCNEAPARRGTEVVDDADVAAVDRRLASREAVVLGPLFGADMAQAAAVAAEREMAVLTDAGISAHGLDALAGDRRPICYQPARAACDIVRDDLEITCRLPCAVHISSLLEELLQPDRHLQ